MKTIRLIELFAGYGSQAMALKRLGLPFEHHFVCEIDKYAVASYNAVHGTFVQATDIKDVHAEDLQIVSRDDYTYLLTYSFPCTDLSIAGDMQGMKKGEGTRSGLLWEVERLLLECGDNLPQFLFMENVPQIHNYLNIADFNKWIEFLDGLGYKSKWQDLNAKDYGVAQNRDRCFMISWLERGFCYQFPQPVPLTRTMTDYLDDNVARSYYLNSEKADRLIDLLIAGDPLNNEKQGIDLNVKKPKAINVSNTIKAKARGISNVKSDETGVREFIRINANNSSGFYDLKEGGVLDASYPTSKTRRSRIYDNGDTCPPIRSQSAKEIMRMEEIKTSYKIRRLTEIECLRLMGVSEEDAQKMRSVNSATQIYKQAGNSIVVDVMVAIFDNLFNDKDEMPGQMSIYDYL